MELTGVCVLIFLLIAAAAGIAAICLVSYLWDKYNWDEFGGILFIVVAFFIVAFASYNTLTFIVGEPEYEMVYDHSYEIYNMEDNFTIKGSRYYFEQNENYYYYAAYKGGKKQYHLSTLNSYVDEDKNAAPHIEVYKPQMKNPTSLQKLVYRRDEYIVEYKIVVPEKTLSTDFNVDMKD